MKKGIKIATGIALTFLCAFIVLLVLISKHLGIPRPLNVYLNHNEYTGREDYTLVYKDKVMFLDIEPSCALQCVLEPKQVMEIESIETEGDQTIYILYYKSPGEKGSQYRKILIQHPNSIEDEMGRIREASSYDELMSSIYSK